MQVNEIVEQLKTGTKVMIQFSKYVDEHESDLDSGMIGFIVDFTIYPDRQDPAETYITLCVDLTPYLEHNKLVAKPNYYDRHGAPTLTCFEADVLLNNRTWLYTMPTDDIGVLYNDKGVDSAFELWWSGYDVQYFLNKLPEKYHAVFIQFSKDIAYNAWNTAIRSVTDGKRNG